MAIVFRSPILENGTPVSDEYFGSSVSLSADGFVLAVGISYYSVISPAVSNAGGVAIYDWSGSAWVQRGSILIAPTPTDGDEFGASVSLSEDGAVLVVGVPYRSNQGIVYVYDWSGSAWVLRGSGITAADNGAGDRFGVSVSISSDASVLAVGAHRWDGSFTDQGGVYLFDWSGSAWLQRNSGPFTASDANTTDLFGISVSLSADGSVLAVGASRWEGSTTDHGAVYVYDWSGTTLVQRGSVISASDLSGSDDYGNGVALSANGLVLAVGAPGWEGANTNQGGVYLYDWNGSAWVQRGSVLQAYDAVGFENYGYGVSLSELGDVIAVGALYRDSGIYTSSGAVYIYDSVDPTGTAIARTKLTVTAEGAAQAETELTISPATASAVAATSLTVTASTGVLSVSTRLTVTASGAAVAVTRLSVTDTGTPQAPTELTLAWPSGKITASTELTVTASGAASASTLLAVTPPASTHVPTWSLRCLIDGVDVSAQLVGNASVTADEGAARIAQLTLQPPSGTIAPLDYVGKTISLDYVLVVSGVAVPRRVFTGRIDTPFYDPATTLLRLDCVDDLQNRVASLERSVIDDLIGGRYTESVQGELDDNWDYAKALLSTVQASLDAGPSGGMRVTPWQLPTSFATFGASALLYQQCRLALPQRSTLVNHVDIAFDYRYPRLRQRYTSIGWSGTQLDMRGTGYAYPKQQDILGAAGGSGWTVTLGVFYPAPASIPYPGGGFVIPDEGSIDMAIVYLAQRHSQTVTEGYTLAVTAPESVTLNGELPRAIRGALASEFDGQAWESAMDVEPLLPGGGEMDYAPDADRSDADYAIQTLLDQANAIILGSHREARLTNAVLCNPEIDLDKRLTIDTAEVQASGKVAALVHSFDLDSGSALTEFSLAIFGVGGAGIITPDTLEPPEAPAEAEETQDWRGAVPSLFVNLYGRNVYSENLMGLLLNPPETITVEDVPGEGTVTYPNPEYVAGSYPVTGFRVAMPGVDDADRNPIELPIEQSYQVLIPSDTLTFTIP